MADQSHISRLPHAPLKEVIFELLWEIGIDSQGNPHDSDFDLVQGVFAREMKKTFPVHKRTIPEGAKIKIYPKAIHQFWKGEGEWPVVQIGPGILAINDTSQTYRWESFQSLIAEYTALLEDSYGKKLEYITASLRYIDAVEVDGLRSERGILDFINANFNLEISNKFTLDGKVSNFNINQTFDIGQDSFLNFLISDGSSKNNKPAIIWQTNVSTRKKMNRDETLHWIEFAHDITSQTFKNTLNQDFYDSFK